MKAFNNTTASWILRVVMMVAFLGVRHVSGTTGEPDASSEKFGTSFTREFVFSSPEDLQEQLENDPELIKFFKEKLQHSGEGCSKTITTTIETMPRETSVEVTSFPTLSYLSEERTVTSSYQLPRKLPTTLPTVISTKPARTVNLKDTTNQDDITTPGQNSPASTRSVVTSTSTSTPTEPTTTSPTTTPTTASTALRLDREGWYQAKNGFRYNHFRDERKKYHEATANCSAYSGRLASTGIRNDTIKHQLIHNFGLTQNYYWIGLTKNTEETWHWSDGESQTDISVTGNSKKDCAAIKENDGWDYSDHMCNSKKAYICEIPCELYHNGDCFRVLLNSRATSFSQADSMCGIGWSVANIYDTDHYHEVANYTRAKIYNDANIWLGMTYNRTTGSISGWNMPSSTMRYPWYTGYPNGNASNIAIYVRNDKTGLANKITGSSLDGVLCKLV